mgnify:CR=1 FL=1
MLFFLKKKKNAAVPPLLLLFHRAEKEQCGALYYGWQGPDLIPDWSWLAAFISVLPFINLRFQMYNKSVSLYKTQIELRKIKYKFPEIWK